MVRLTDRPDMTLDVYRGRKTTNQHQSTILKVFGKNFYTMQSIMMIRESSGNVSNSCLFYMLNILLSNIIL